MRKKRIKLKYKKERILLSEVLPYELPLIFSNRYFYRFLVKNRIVVNDNSIEWSADLGNDVLSILSVIFGVDYEKMIKNNNNPITSKKVDNYSIPFSFNIIHKPTTNRTLSIIHPLNQILMIDFYDKHKELILYLCNLDRFSIRYPNKEASYIYYRDRLHNSLLGSKSDNLELVFNEYENLRSFFSYKQYTNIYKFYDDYRWQRAEKKFSHLMKLDIQSCFDSIYTHSIAWAIGGGKQIYKENFKCSDVSFAFKWDKLMQKMNYNETNGIVIGPEFSRLFAEVIFQKIDCNIDKCLSIKWHWGSDFVCYRYVDDYFFFYNDEECKKDALSLFIENLKEYKLRISEEKSTDMIRPFLSNISMAKMRIDELIQEKMHFDGETKDKDEEDKDGDLGSKDEKIEIANLEKLLEVNNSLYINSLFINKSYKDILVSCNVEPKDVANYLLFKICRKLEVNLKKFDSSYRKMVLIRDLSTNQKVNKELLCLIKKREAMMSNFLINILEVVFFIYYSNPRINTTLRLINILNVIVLYLEGNYLYKNNVCKKFSNEIKEVVFKKIQEEITLVIKMSKTSKCIQIESLYLLIVLKQLRSKYHIEPLVFNDLVSGDKELNAISIIVFLYYFGNEMKYKYLKEIMMDNVKKKFDNIAKDKRQRYSELCILTLDLVACPYITEDDKKEITKQMGISQDQLKQMLQFFKKHKYMFTKWNGINLNKELSAKLSQEVYA